MSFLVIEKSKKATNIEFQENKMIVFLEDGRSLVIPLEWFPKLRDASIAELNKYRFIGDGQGIHWEGLDEDILIENLF